MLDYIFSGFRLRSSKSCRSNEKPPEITETAISLSSAQLAQKDVPFSNNLNFNRLDTNSFESDIVNCSKCDLPDVVFNDIFSACSPYESYNENLGNNAFISYESSLSKNNDVFRRNDREEIRRRLATGDSDDYPTTDRPGKKPSLHSRLQSGMNLQICFMNDAMSDTESPGSDGSPLSMPAPVKPKAISDPQPRSLMITSQSMDRVSRRAVGPGKAEEDLTSHQARLQAEARLALSQAKDIARAQMHHERRKYQTSPITDMLRASLRKVGVILTEDRRRVSRQLLTDMNVAQLQVIVNDLHSQIEVLNEDLVKFLMERDELHMSQDSMLVDIEDLTRYLGAKDSLMKEEVSHNINQNNNISPKTGVRRIPSLNKK